MNKDTIMGCLLVLVIPIVVVLSFAWYSYTCGQKWSSFDHRWKIVGGCQINVGGKWIPAESYYFKQE